MKKYEIVMTAVGPRNQWRIVVTEEANSRREAERNALKRGRKMTGRRMRVSARCA